MPEIPVTNAWVYVVLMACVLIVVMELIHRRGRNGR